MAIFAAMILNRGAHVYLLNGSILKIIAVLICLQTTEVNKMRTIEKTVYAFDELSESAKEKAREWFRNGYDGVDLEFVIEDFTRICDIIGVYLDCSSVRLMNGSTREKPEVFYSVGYCQSDYAAFNGEWRYEKGASKNIREYAPLDKTLHALVDKWCALQKRHFYGLRARCSEKRGNQYVNEVIKAGYTKSGYWDEQSVDYETEKAAESIVNDLSHWLYRRLESEVDYQMSDETVDENIRANGYEFFENGEIA